MTHQKQQMPTLDSSLDVNQSTSRLGRKPDDGCNGNNDQGWEIFPITEKCGYRHSMNNFRQSAPQICRKHRYTSCGDALESNKFGAVLCESYKYVI
jgi:hypothetical protein